MLTLRRKIYTERSTLGELVIDQLLPIWYVLEDASRDLNRDGDLSDPGEVKVWGQTCIPAGTYTIRWQYSPHFKKRMPYLQDVPGFTGVMIHTGNKVEHTRGCLLVGKKPFRKSDAEYEVHSSTQAFNEIISLALRNEKGGEQDNVIQIIDEEPQGNPV